MMNTENKVQVVCFGEVLWDIFPGNNRRAGGAPFNVAYHLSKMGIKTRMISGVGEDVLGKELIEKIKNWNISSDGIQIIKEHPTSTVIAEIDENNEAHYTITENVAWDFIQSSQKNIEFVKAANALVFGSLIARNSVSRKTLFELVENSSFNVFDINLRKPHDDIKLISELLYKTHLAKFNKAELKIVLGSIGKEYTNESDSIKYIQEKFNIDEIIVSKGSKGALYANEDAIFQYPAVPITVVDTVGSGDSFLAGLLSKRLSITNDVHSIMLQAVSLGAFITSKEGACPEYSLKEFEDFRGRQNIAAISI
ncbi:carbohydrate kinase family protein [Flavobacterium luteolum]|uniref:carbohydrate kinase family protein n=1 Tax=Flavobacterium luteolum TaxID=3003259 RepID=UPI00248E28A3|nr:carbohydrate kinase [Flavobacterium luteolum]